jgi:hypothetical protein
METFLAFCVVALTKERLRASGGLLLKTGTLPQLRRLGLTHC